MTYTDPNRQLWEILTVTNLTKAIMNSIDERKMAEDAARDLASHVMNFFGFNERIIDNVLEPEDRDAFYMLEDAGLLTTEREETTLYDGREWRIHYWMFRKDVILKLVDDISAREAELAIVDASVYDEIPDDVWLRT